MFPAPMPFLELLPKLKLSRPKKYEIVELIAEGGYARIFKVVMKNNREGGYFVLKTNRHEGYDGIVTNIDFNEVRSLRKLKNESHVIKLVEFMKDHKKFYVVLEYCRIDISKLLHGRVPLTLSDKKNILRQIFIGIAEIHKHKIIHRDLKPQNILLTMSGIVKISDFGSAVDLDLQSEFKTHVSTVWYRSPEILLGHTRYDQTTDLWSAGCLAFEFWSDRALFMGVEPVTQTGLIFAMCGFCSELVWPDAKDFPNYQHFQIMFGGYKENKLEKHLMEVTSNKDATNLLCKLLKLNATERMTADKAINHSFLHSNPKASPDLYKLLLFLEKRKIK